ncbi:MAG: glycosyltransferase [Lachnospiraceae bacterium]|nr:glycosyltransferase [Lachnospiraceae bacterium]
MNNVNVTIVTVCFNAGATIAATIESVLRQDYRDFEYLIVDGLSTDNTMDIVRNYEQKFADRGIQFRYISEKDGGIFDAMNKAADNALGSWIEYMNADDKFHSDTVLSEVFACDVSDADVIYGDTVRIREGVGSFGKALPVENINLNMPFCHQSSFVKTSVMRDRRFDLKYRVADYNFFLRLYKDGGKFKRVDVTIADYSLEGFSNENKYKTYLGTLEIKHDLGMINKNSFKQKLKNIYFKQLLDDKALCHGLISAFDRMVKGKKRN